MNWLKHLFTHRCFYHELSELIREHLDETELGLALSQNVKSPPEASVFPRKEHGREVRNHLHYLSC
jgi:hypothetical protein